MGHWLFLTNHTHVLVCLARDHGIRMAEVAATVGISERAVHRIVKELEEGGYVQRRRRGRRNEYDVNLDAPMRHGEFRGHKVREIIEPLTEMQDRSAARGGGSRPS